MKTLIKLFALLLSVVFSTEIEAQNSDVTTSVIQHDVTNTISIDHSPNGQYTVVAVDGYDDGSGNPFNGYAAVYCNTCTGYTYGHEIATYTLYKGTTGAVGVVLGANAATISNNGNTYFFFQNTVIGNTFRYVLQKNGTEIMYFDDMGASVMKVFNGYLYFFIGNTNTNEAYLYKIDENTNQVVFATPVSQASISEMLLMPNGNIAGKVRPGNVGEGNLYEFDANTGAELGLIRSGNPYGREKFGDNGDLEVYDNDMQKFLVYSQGSGWASAIKETNMPDPTKNLFGLPLKDWEFVGNEFHGIYYGYFMILSDNLVHGSLHDALSNIMGGMLDMWFNNDGTYTVIYKDNNNAIHMLKAMNTPLDTSLIPTVNVTEDVADGRNGQVYNNGWQSVDPHILTLVIDDVDMPSVGDTPDSSWLTPPSGYTYGGAYPIRDDGQGLVYDAICYYNFSNREYVRVFIKAASEVAGVQENTLSNFTVYPNPASDYINVSAGKDISQIEILDINGRSVLKQDTTNQTKIFIGDLSPGVYVIRVQAGNQTGTHKWIKL